jgi:hypothetical protein
LDKKIVDLEHVLAKNLTTSVKHNGVGVRAAEVSYCVANYFYRALGLVVLYVDVAISIDSIVEEVLTDKLVL